VPVQAAVARPPEERPPEERPSEEGPLEEGPLEEWTPPPPLRFSGTKLVIVLIVFGTAATSVLWIYSYTRFAPYRPLQEAVAAEALGGRVTVEGGRYKRGPNTLRVIVILNRPLAEDDAEAERLMNRIDELAHHHVDLSQFDKFETYLVTRLPQQPDRRLERVVDLRESEQPKSEQPKTEQAK
jgi:hypothetical protein